MLPKRGDDVTAIMKHVQGCPWNPFKLNEIVTLERCLQDSAELDPQLAKILRKLASECVFVEPSRKINYLQRDETCKARDLNLVKETKAIQKEINNLKGEIQFYRNKLAELSEKEDETRLQLVSLPESIITLEAQGEISVEKFGFVLEQVHASFDRSLKIIGNKIPTFLDSLPNSSLLKKFNDILYQYRRAIITSCKHSDLNLQNQQLSTQFSFEYKKKLSEQLSKYLKEIETVYGDLILIDKVYSDEILEEVEHLKSLNTHIEYLEKEPHKDTPKRILTTYYDLQVDDPTELSIVGPPARCQDKEFHQLFKELSDWLESHQGSN